MSENLCEFGVSKSHTYVLIERWEQYKKTSLLTSHVFELGKFELGKFRRTIRRR